MKNEQKTHVGNTNKSVSQCSPSIHTTLLTYIEEKITHITGNIARKEAEDDIFIDADDLQLELFGSPHLSKEFILKSILSV